MRHRMRRGKALVTLLLALALWLAAAGGTAEVPQVRDAFPDLSLRDVNGGSWTVSGLLASHDAVLIKLFVTWSPACSREMPAVQQVYEEYGGRVAVIAVGVDANESEDTLRDWANGMGLGFPVARGGEKWLAMARELQDVPVSLVVGRDGTLTALYVGAAGADQLRSLVETALY